MAKPTPATNATTTTLQLGYYNPFNENAGSDGFTLAADLNDYSSTFIMPGTLKLAAAEKSYVETGNIRSGGISVVRWQYKNRALDISISIRAVSYSAFQTALAAIKTVIETPPFCIRMAYPGASQYSYLDVMKVTHNIPSDPILYNNKAWPHYELHFECLPGIRGDRVWLQNLCMNPGFETPGGSPVQVFNDTFANINAYTTISGTPSSIASGMSLPGGARVTFGSTAWGAINSWQLRWQMSTALTAFFFIHYTDGSNFLAVKCDGANLVLQHTIGGTNHTLASVACALTAGNWYWLKATMFPQQPQGTNNPSVQATIYNDAAGTLGSQVATSQAATFDAATAMTGKMGIQATNATMLVGGAFSGVHVVSLFGPGAWSISNSGTGVAAGAWDGSRTDLGMSGTSTFVYGLGPVVSFGAARIDIAPAGTVNAQWVGNDPANLAVTGMPVLPGQVLQVSGYVLSSGISSNCVTGLYLNEYSGAGTLLRQTQVAATTGVKASYFPLAGAITIGASSGYASLVCLVSDTNASAGGTVWFDNLQCWNQTLTGMAAGQMPYCELRHYQSPAQLMVSGILGDMPAPAYLGFAAYTASWGPGSYLKWVIGRQANTPTSKSQALLVGKTQLYGLSTTPVLDATAWGGFYQKSAVSSPIEEHFANISAISSLAGAYHLWTRASSTQSTGNIGNVTVTAGGNDGAYALESAQIAPLVAGSTWTDVDAGQVSYPLTAYGGITANPLGNTNIFPRIMWRDSTGGASAIWSDWGALIPCDASLLTGILYNPSNNVTTSTSWNWVYNDPLAMNTDLVGAGVAWRLYAGGTAQQDPETGVGGPGTSTGSFINVNPACDAYMTLDPTTGAASSSSGAVNLFGALMTDGASSVLPFICDFSYSPLYLWPR